MSNGLRSISAQDDVYESVAAFLTRQETNLKKGGKDSLRGPKRHGKLKSLLRGLGRAFVFVAKITIVGGCGMAAAMFVQKIFEQQLNVRLEQAKLELQAHTEAMRCEMHGKVHAAEHSVDEAKKDLAITVALLHQQLKKQEADHAKAQADMEVTLAQLHRRVEHAERRASEAQMALRRAAQRKESPQATSHGGCNATQ